MQINHLTIHGAFSILGVCFVAAFLGCLVILWLETRPRRK